MRTAWLLDLQVGGQVLRYATKGLEVLDSRGRRYRYHAGLSDFELELDGMQEQQGLAVLDRRVDWALLASRGENLDRATAVLRHWLEGDLLEEAMVVLQGELTDPEYADPKSPDTFVATLKVAAETDRTWPSPQAAVNTSTWERGATGNTYDEGIEGAVYPTIFGHPGEGDEVVDPPVPALPALLVHWNQSAVEGTKLLIGYGRLDCVGGQVYVRDRTADDDIGYNQEWLDVIEETDGLGQVVTLVDVADGAGVYGFAGHEYFFGMSRSPGKGGGNTIPGGSAPMRTLADMQIFCLRNSGRAVDLEAQEGERVYFDSYSLDGMLNEEVQLVPWFEAEILPLFPAVRARTARGIYWKYVNWWATATEAVAHLDADARRVTRSSSVRVPEGQVYNWFQVEFQLNQGATGARRTLTDQAEEVLPWWENPDLLADDRIIGSPALAASQALYGIRQAETVRSDYIWKESTAISVLQYLAVRDSFPRRFVSYEGSASELRHLTHGDIVTVTDSRARFDRAVAMVDSVRLSGDRLCTVALSVLDKRRLG
jgi:hypothetical protein